MRLRWLWSSEPGSVHGSDPERKAYPGFFIFIYVAWAVARITRLTSSDEVRARVCVCVCVCIRHVAQYLRWTLHSALSYEPVKDLKWHCYADASWVPEGDPSS